MNDVIIYFFLFCCEIPNTKVVLRLKKTERNLRSATMSTSVLVQVAHFELFLTFQARNKGEQLL